MMRVNVYKAVAVRDGQAQFTNTPENLLFELTCHAVPAKGDHLAFDGNFLEVLGVVHSVMRGPQDMPLSNVRSVNVFVR